MRYRNLVFIFLFVGGRLIAQEKYVYSVDLTKVEDDKVLVRLVPPKILKNTIVFHFPKIIPGTYRVSDYGKFASEFKALDKNGKPLSMKKISENSWQISGANHMGALEYRVEDTYDSKIVNDIYSMAGTNIEEGKNFVINSPGFFGYFEGMQTLPFELNFTKPESFYAATPLTAKHSTATKDVFLVNDLDDLYDAPIMFSAPDTASIQLGTSNVLIAVYSPKKLVQAKYIAALLSNILIASAKYLGGRLPVDKYAFIFYFHEKLPPGMVPGALEHNYSSFYSLPEAPQQALAPTILDIGAHEFFHVVTPLTIRSKEVKNFNFSKPVLSKHLWLYEGSTEYASDHVQVKYGLNTIAQFFEKISGKIRNSKSSFNDTLAFTELSHKVTDKYKEQFGNVYEKGALISACLDIYLLHLSRGSYDLVKMKHDLSIRYGKKIAFDDAKLFDAIAELTYPEVREFFAKYVEGNQSLPYEYFFSLAGVKYDLVSTRSDFSLGNVSIGADQNGRVFIFDISKINSFGKKMGYEKMDEILTINGVQADPNDVQSTISKTKAGLKEGVPLVIQVIRTNSSGGKDTVILSAPAEKIEIRETHKLSLMPNLTAAQAAVRRAWLASGNEGVPVTVDNNDVTEIDQVINTLYDVISGPAGTRNWERFRSLYIPGAFMGSTVPSPGGGTKFITFTPEEYISKNSPIFMQDSFVEKEIARKIQQYGNIAQVFTSYEFDFGNGKMKQRGINSVQLVKEQGRWWIASIIWQDESKSLPIPQQFLKQ